MANIKLLALAGYASRGIVYLIVGGLAAFAAFAQGGSTTDIRGGLTTQRPDLALAQAVADRVGGRAALFAVWRLVQALLDADCHGTSAKGLLIRAGLASSGITYISLGVFALSTVLGWGFGGGGGDSREAWTAKLLSQPAGAWLESCTPAEP